MKIYPTDDPTRAIVMDPETKQPLPAEGKEVANNDMHWLHMLKLGDVTTEAPKAVADRLAAEKARAEAARSASQPAADHPDHS